jgi:cytochrome P450
MIAYPAKQRKCQEELDNIVGRSRMPTFEDRDNLPYLKATVRELLRWRAISPLGTASGSVRTPLTNNHILAGNEHATKEVRPAPPDRFMTFILL